MAVLAGMFYLVPDLVELKFDHAVRHVEAVPVRQLVQQLALQLGAAHLAVFLANLVTHGGGQRFQALRAQRLGELVVDRGVDLLAQLLHVHREFRGGAGKFGIAIIVGELQVEDLFLPHFRTVQIGVELRQQLVVAKLDKGAFRGRTLDRDAIGLADIVHHHCVAGRGRSRLFHRLGPVLVVGDVLQRIVDRLVGDRGGQPFQLDVAEFADLDLRQLLQRDRELDVLLRLHRLHVDLGLGRRTDATIGDRFVDAAADRLLDLLRIKRLAEAALQQRLRCLALAEPRQVRCLGHLVETRVDTLAHLGRTEHDLELALQPFVERLGNLHPGFSPNTGRRRQATGNGPTAASRRRWCGRRDLNPHGLRHQILNLACLPIPPRPHPTVTTRSAPQNSSRACGAAHRHSCDKPGCL